MNTDTLYSFFPASAFSSMLPCQLSRTENIMCPVWLTSFPYFVVVLKEEIIHLTNLYGLQCTDDLLMFLIGSTVRVWCGLLHLLLLLWNIKTPRKSYSGAHSTSHLPTQLLLACGFQNLIRGFFQLPDELRFIHWVQILRGRTCYWCQTETGTRVSHWGAYSLLDCVHIHLSVELGVISLNSWTFAN